MESEMKTILGAFLVIALTASPSLAVRKVWSQQGTHHVYKYGWGWDSRWGGYYVGPIFKGNQKGYFAA